MWLTSCILSSILVAEAEEAIIFFRNQVPTESGTAVGVQINEVLSPLKYMRLCGDLGASSY